MPGILRSVISRSYSVAVEAVERRRAVRRRCPRRSRPSRASSPRSRTACRRRRRRGVVGAAVATALADDSGQPGVDVVLPEAPLAADAHGDLAGLDQPVDRPEVDLEVVQTSSVVRKGRRGKPLCDRGFPAPPAGRVQHAVFGEQEPQRSTPRVNGDLYCGETRQSQTGVSLGPSKVTGRSRASSAGAIVRSPNT